MLWLPVEILEWWGRPVRAKIKDLQRLENLSSPGCCPPICSTSHACHSTPVIPWRSQHQLSLTVRGQSRTSKKRREWWPCGERVAQGTLVLLFVPLRAQPTGGCSFSFLPHPEYLTILHVAEQLQPKWLNLTSHITWGNGAFQRGCACMSQEVEERFGPRSFISRRKALIAGFLSKRAHHGIGSPCQLHKTHSGTAGICLNIRYYNTRLFGDYR